jgi:hypothetical protein
MRGRFYLRCMETGARDPRAGGITGDGVGYMPGYTCWSVVPPLRGPYIFAMSVTRMGSVFEAKTSHPRSRNWP